MQVGAGASSWTARVTRGLGVALVALMLDACSTPAPTRSQPQAQAQAALSQMVAVDTPGVPGARCTLTSVTVGRQTIITPGSIEVDRSPEIIVVLCRKPCYLDTSTMITPEGLRRPDGSVVYGYPAETQLTMRPAQSCDASAGTARGAAP